MDDSIATSFGFLFLELCLSSRGSVSSFISYSTNRRTTYTSSLKFGKLKSDISQSFYHSIVVKLFRNLTQPKLQEA